MKTTLRAVPLALLAVLSLGATARAADDRGYQNPWEDYATLGVNNCGGEDFLFSGQHILRVHVSEDSSGGLHVSTLDRTRGTGVGMISGSRYVSAEGGHVAENYIASGPVNLTLPFNGQLNALDPSVPDTHYSFLLHVTINGNGELTSSIDTFEIRCPRTGGT